MNAAFEAGDEVEKIKKEMAECELPVTIQVRRNEINALMLKLETIRNELKDLKQADADFEGDSASEAEIKSLIEQIEKMLTGYEEEGKALQSH